MFHRFVAGYIGSAQNRHLAVIAFPRLDRFKRGSSQNSTNSSPASVGFWHARRHTDVFASVFYEERSGHPLAVFFSNRVDDVKVVIDLGRSEIQSGSILTANGFPPFELGGSQFRCQ